jgi:hypothetical protein
MSMPSRSHRDRDDDFDDERPRSRRRVVNRNEEDEEAGPPRRRRSRRPAPGRGLGIGVWIGIIGGVGAFCLLATVGIVFAIKVKSNPANQDNEGGGIPSLFHSGPPPANISEDAYIRITQRDTIESLKARFGPGELIDRRNWDKPILNSPTGAFGEYKFKLMDVDDAEGVTVYRWVKGPELICVSFGRVRNSPVHALYKVYIINDPKRPPHQNFIQQGETGY